jgi:adenine phosphoribosyltransferase
MNLEALIRTVPDHPKPGVMFRDITTLLKDAAGLRAVVDALAARHRDRSIDLVAGIESRGFIVAAPLAYALGAGFVPLRKKGKLPAATMGEDYALEYGTDRIEMHVDAVRPGQRVLLADDLVATGGTAEAAIRLIEAARGVIAECAFIVELPDLGGRARLEGLGHSVHALVSFAGD